MSAKSDTWMPFYVGDYLADTQRFTREQHGAYLLLILDYWTQGPAPDDDAVLAAICKATPAEWKRLRAVLAPKFQVGDGVWRHGRIDKELARAKAHIDQRSAAGKASAEARKLAREAIDKATTVATTVEFSLATGEQREGRTPPSPSQTPISTTNVVEVPGGENQPPATLLPDRPKKTLPDCDHVGVVAAYHAALPMCPQVIEWNATRRGYLQARWREKGAALNWQTAADGVAYFTRYFDHVRESKFLTGRANGKPGQPPFIADLEWLLRPNNFAKVVEGKYHGA